MFLKYIIITIVQFTEALDVSLHAEVSFDIKITNLDVPVHKYRSVQQGTQKTNDSHYLDALPKVTRNKNYSNVTAAPLVECVYQYPETRQVNAILSNMMNELTKVFVHARNFLEIANGRRSQDKRFKVIGNKNNKFFENIFSNMTQDYKTYYNNTVERVNRSGRDPCLHQEEMKQMWRHLLNYSIALYRRSALSCIEEYLKTQNWTYEVGAKNKLGQFLKKQIATIKYSQLNTLCDDFQLCYNELL